MTNISRIASLLIKVAVTIEVVVLTSVSSAAAVGLESYNKNSNNNTNETTEVKYIKVVDWIGDETITYLFVFIFIAIVSIVKLLYHRFENIVSIIPESLLLILGGILVGLIHKYNFHTRLFRLTPNLFFLVLLPPIVLDSAFNLYNRTFGEMFGIVVLMAVIGTVLCFVVIGLSLYGLEVAGAMGTWSTGNPSPTDGNLGSILQFSALIVAVDPVAVLAIFKDLGVDRELYYMVFGESLFNDAVTIVLYDIVESFLEAGPNGVSVINVILGLCSFVTVSGGGLLIGIIIGFLSSLTTRVHSRNPMHTLLIISSAFLAYLIAYSLKWSGIISMIACGIVQASYAFKNLPSSTLTTLREIVELSAGVCEAIIFAHLGFELLLEPLVWHFGFMAWAIVMCLVSRFVVSFGLVKLINWVRVDQRKVTWTELFVIVYGGLRGAVAFSLAVLIEPKLMAPFTAYSDISESRGKEIQNLFVSTTLLIILFTVVVMGTTMKPLAKLLKVKTEENQVWSLNKELNFAVIDSLMCAVEDITNQRGRNRLRVIINRIDQRYIRPFIVVNSPYNNSACLLLKRYEQISLALHYATSNISKCEGDNKIYLKALPPTLWPGKKPRKSRFSLSRSANDDQNNLELTAIKSMKQTVNSIRSGDIESDPSHFSSLLELSVNNKLMQMNRKISLQEARVVDRSQSVSASNTIDRPRSQSVKINSKSGVLKGTKCHQLFSLKDEPEEEGFSNPAFEFTSYDSTQL